MKEWSQWSLLAYWAWNAKPYDFKGRFSWNRKYIHQVLTSPESKSKWPVCNYTSTKNPSSHLKYGKKQSGQSTQKGAVSENSAKLGYCKMLLNGICLNGLDFLVFSFSTCSCEISLLQCLRFGLPDATLNALTFRAIICFRFSTA